MKNEILYPKNIEDLNQKINYIISNDENIDRIHNMEKWLKWFSNLNLELKFKLNSNEYLRAYYKNDECSLQVWVHDDNVDFALYDLIANNYGKYYVDDTIIVKN